MKILVTGGTGFLGRHLIKTLSEKSEVYLSNTKQANLHHYEDFCNYFEGNQFDFIYHLAAKTKAGDYCLSHKGEQWIDNQLLNTNILRYWVEKQPQSKMICMGTSCMYQPSENPLEEQDCCVGDPDPGLKTYALTKRMLLSGLQSISEQYGLKYLYFIPSTLYGPEFDLNDSHFIFDLIKKIYRGKNSGGYDLGGFYEDPVILWGDGHQRRELIYIEDVVKIMCELATLENEVVNLGTGHDNSIREFASCVSKNIGYDESKIQYDVTKYTGAKIKILSPKKLSSLMPPHFDFTSLEDGIKKTIDFYVQKMGS
jgi:GDP-L-fucose synthase